MKSNTRITESVAPTTDLVVLNNKRAVTTSIKVAEVFGKQHKNVLQSIDALDCSGDFRRLNFQPSNYPNKQGKTQPMVEMTRDGFTFLAMGFTGKKAAQFKEQYIAAFNEMEAALKAAPELTADQKLLALAQGVIELTTWKEEAKPKVAYYDRFVDPKGALPLQTIGEQLNWDPDEFIEQLRKDKFIYSHDGTDVPFQRYIENRVLRLFLDDGDGHGNLNGQTRATVKGALILACEYGTAAERAEAKQQLKQLRRQQRLREAGAAGVKPKLRLIKTSA
jgi:Rha family phage regulatory protein